MKKFIRFSLKVALLLAISVFLWPSQAQAQCTFTNGDFETGTLSGWTKYFRSQNAGDWFNYSGTATPLTSHTISAPMGTRAAVTDHNAPTTHELYQDVTIPAGQSTITFYMAYNNTNGFFVTLNTLDWVNNQQARIDIVRTTTPNESIVSNDILSPLYQTRPGDPLIISPMSQFFFDTSGLAGQTVRLRFAEAVGLNYFPVAIDNVCLSGGLTTFSKNTPTGSRVTTNLGDVSVLYNSVTVAGNTSVQQLGTGTQSSPPVGETFTGPAYDLSTTATVTAPMTVCIHTPPGADRSHIRLVHKVAGIWVDVASSRVNESLRAVCGDVTSLSPFAMAINPALPTSAPSTISGTIATSDGAPLAGATVSMDGANSRKTITDSNGAYRFENVETNNLYTVTASRVNYTFSPASRSLSVLGNVADASFSATRGSSGANEIDSPDIFVRQHYIDFLGREPDESGFNFWSDQMLSCGGDSSCFERRRINVSAAYFLSVEFQQTGGVVDALYRASYNRRPMYDEFMPDAATVGREVVVGRGDWARQLEANRAAFIAAWVERPTFRAAYDNLANDAFVDTLVSHTGSGFNGDRAALVNGLTNGTLTRAAVLRQIAENEGFVRAKSNQMFVMMEYFGYLRRDPDENGYQFWLNKLNQFNGNFEQAEMVKSFIVSGEYRARFQ
jgi:hypothetical protein